MCGLIWAKRWSGERADELDAVRMNALGWGVEGAVDSAVVLGIAVDLSPRRCVLKRWRASWSHVSSDFLLQRVFASEDKI